MRVTIKVLNPAPPVLMWAAIAVTGQRSEWIQHHTIRATRRDAKAAYLEGWNTDPKTQRKVLKYVRFARVVVTVEGGIEC